jgi:hypothetical protein
LLHQAPFRHKYARATTGENKTRQQAGCLGQASLVAPKPGEGARGTQLEQQRRLRAGNRERAPELTFGPAYIVRTV